MDTKEQKVNKFITSIHAKVSEDKDFKKDLIDNPIETLNKFAGRKADIAADKSVIVEDQTNPSHVYLNIPAKPDKFNVQSAEESQE
jgi:hypothetical protein